MKQGRTIIAAIAVVAVSSFAIGSLARMPHSNATPNKVDQPKKDKIAAALDSLEQQLQRRFHDRQNIQFGYSRVVRRDARIHGGVVSGKMGLGLVRDDGVPMKSREKNGEREFEVEEGVWIKTSELKQLMYSENEAERKLKDDLKQTDVAIYTAGAFDSQSGEPMRIKGPAYLRQSSAKAPEASTIGKTVATGWKTSNDADEMRLSGWLFRVVKVRADDKSCLSCHNAMRSGGGQEMVNSVEVKLNEPLGTFVIAAKVR